MMAARWARWALAAACATALAAPALCDLALGAASSGERQGHTAAHAFDGSSATFWQSKSPAAGQWLTYTFPSPQTVLQYSLSGSSDPRWVAADGLVSFELQGSADGANWTTIDRRFDERLWQPGETRIYSVRTPAAGDAAMVAYPSFRLVVVKVPGRTLTESFASVSELRFLTAENMPPFCDSLPDVVVNVTTAGAPPPDEAGAGAPNYSLYIFVNVTNTGPNPLRMRGLHLPLRFSRGVQGWDGAWSAPAPSTFNASCWGAYLTDPSLQADPFRMRAAGPVRDMCAQNVLAAVTPWGVDVQFTGGILCAGCSFSGPPGGLPMIAVQHASFGALDVASAVPAAPACGAAPPALDPLPLPGAERHPACAPWTPPAPQPPACAPAAAVATLQAALSYSYIDAPDDGSGPLPARELRLRPRLTNSGPAAVDLFGVTVPISFAHRVRSEADAPWADAAPSDFELDCFWAQVVTAQGAPVFGQPNACEYMRLDATDGGVAITFLGGRLCAGCVLGGGTAPADATVNVKHTEYFQLFTTPPPALGPISCAAPAAPPPRCVSAAAPAPAQAAPM